jgi:hypothetical protein
VTTLAALISGMVASKNTQLPTIASQVPDGTKPESRVKRCARGVDNARVSEAVSFVPSAEVLLERVALETLVVVIDGSVVGRGCVALMVPVVSQGRALPLCWLVRQGKKGPFPADLPIAVVEQVQEMIPLGASVVVRGDGACDGIGLQQTLEEAGWSYVCRTGCNLTAPWDGETFRLETLGWCIKPGTLVDFPGACLTAEASGPVRRICCWAKASKDPLDVVTNMASAEQACRLYAKRFRIETCFSDQKSRGFHVHTSPLCDPKRLSRVFIAACLASIWIVSLGSLCVKDGWGQMIHRTERCDLRLFQ